MAIMMIKFILLAALMAAFAAAAVAVPLWRDERGRSAGAIATVLIMAAATALYPLWSNWSWHPVAAAQTASPDVLAMVSKLENRLRNNPNDLQGYLMLGRSYLTLEHFDDAILAYDHAHRLDDSSAEAALGLGEAMSLRAGGNVTPVAAQLFEQALVLEPGNAHALLDGGFAAAARGETGLARARWLTLQDMHPSRDIEQLLEARVAELAPPAVPAVTDVGTSITAGGSASSTGAKPTAAHAEAIVVVSIAAALQARVKGESPLFVFAREPGIQGPPLAAKRLTSGALGTPIHLSAADSMLPGRVLVSGQQVSITARVSFAGQPLPSPGDLYGELTYRVGEDGTRDLVIDHVAN